MSASILCRYTSVHVWSDRAVHYGGRNRLTNLSLIKEKERRAGQVMCDVANTIRLPRIITSRKEFLTPGTGCLKVARLRLISGRTAGSGYISTVHLYTGFPLVIRHISSDVLKQMLCTVANLLDKQSQ